MKKIFLIDGHAQIFRMYYAFMRNPMVNSKGVDTSILFGFTKMVLELINREHPTHIAVAFDPPVKTFRHTAYPEYKANRSAAPDLVKAALEPLQEILAALQIPVIMMPGYEADDVIGSMATQWNDNDTQVFMVTPDKDYGQLINPSVFMYKPAKGGNEIEIIGESEICQHYGITSPTQVIDILTIWGDSSDNVPGVRGIGEVGAKKLVSQYGSLDNIIKCVNELTKRQQDSINSSLEQIEMSRFLITIKTDLELPIKREEIIIKPTNLSEIKEVFSKYEFTSLLKLLNSSEGDNSAEAEQKQVTIQKVERCTIEELKETATKSKEIAFTILEGGDYIYSSGNKFSYLERQELAEIKEIAQNPNIQKIGYNSKQFIKDLKGLNIRFEGKLLDIELMHYIINPERSHKEQMLIKGYLDIDILQIKGEQEDKVANESEPVELDLFSMMEESNVADSNREEELTAKLAEQERVGTITSLLILLKDKLLEELEKIELLKLYREIEAPLVPVLADMEYEGVKIDTAHLKEYSTLLTKELLEIEAKVRDVAENPTLNISSPKQIGVLLYEKLKLNPNVKKSAKGSYPTDEETLHELKELHPVVEQILEYRGVKKLLSTYIDNFPSLISKESGKIHTTFNQALTATGRLSSANPNIQNIPIRTARGREIRKAFITSIENGSIISADYSQIELRLMAHLSGDSGLIEAFNNNKDIHTATAAKVFKVAENEVTKEQRSRAKVANFGIIYGISAFGLSQRLGMSRRDSKALIEEYFISYPSVKEYMNNMIDKGRKEGYVETIYGRKRFLPDINSRNAAVRSFNERNAINAPLQGSAADIIKVAMINVYSRLKREGIKSKMILQVHDELVFDAYPNEVEQLKTIITEEMEQVIKLSIPLIAECGSGANWLEAH